MIKVSRLNALLIVAVSTAVAALVGTLAYALWWNAHFACVAYQP